MDQDLTQWQAEAYLDVNEIYEDLRENTIEWTDDLDTKRFRYSDYLLRTDVPRPGDPCLSWIKEDAQPGQSKARCGAYIIKGHNMGRRCGNPAGQGTPHIGAGSCTAHGGASRKGRALGAWIMAHGYGLELDINPWDALLKAVKIAAGRVAYIQSVLADASDDLELEGRVVRPEEGGILVHPDTGELIGAGSFRDRSWWVEQGRIWTENMARFAKMAVDAGVAAWQIETIEQQAMVVARALNATVAELENELTPDQIERMRQRMKSELLMISSETQGPVRVESEVPNN